MLDSKGFCLVIYKFFCLVVDQFSMRSTYGKFYKMLSDMVTASKSIPKNIIVKSRSTIYNLYIDILHRVLLKQTLFWI